MSWCHPAPLRSAPLRPRPTTDCGPLQPNLTPPVTSVDAALAYRARLQALAPDVTFLMALYLHPAVTPAVVAAAARAGIAGVKAYPRGLTTNSELGVARFEDYWPVFEAMQAHDLVLNLHGEAPPTPPAAFHRAPGAGDADGGEAAAEAVTSLTAEAAFLPTLHALHAAFPRLRVVLEHATSAAALGAVARCGPSVAATVTAHHLWLTLDDWAGDAGNFCRPVAKTPADRVALARAVVDPAAKVFFGSDSAPHPRAAKARMPAAAGCFTQPCATQLVVGALEEAVRLGWLDPAEVGVDALREFLSERGRRFYGLGEREEGRRIVLEKKDEMIAPTLRGLDDGGLAVPSFRAGKPVWSLEWQ